MTKKTKSKGGQRIEIRRARIMSKMSGYRVCVFGKNGEMLTQSEVLTSPAAVEKNIKASFHAWIHSGKVMGLKPEPFLSTTIVDLTGKCKVK